MVPWTLTFSAHLLCRVTVNNTTADHCLHLYKYIWLYSYTIVELLHELWSTHTGVSTLYFLYLLLTSTTLLCELCCICLSESFKQTSGHNKVNDGLIPFSCFQDPGVLQYGSMSRITGTLKYNRALFSSTNVENCLWHIWIRLSD